MPQLYVIPYGKVKSRGRLRGPMTDQLAAAAGTDTSGSLASIRIR
jgi:hypothetical protein